MTIEAPELGRATEALLALATERSWRDITLRDIAQKAELDLAALYAQAPGKAALLAILSAQLDRAALTTAGSGSADVHDRLFDALMGRIEAMEPHRAALTAIAGDSRGLTMAGHFPRTARAVLEAAGLDATPPRVVAMTALWLRVAQVWRDDEGALNRTMAEIDKRLKQLRKHLGRIGAGF